MTGTSDTPAISVILPTPFDFASIATTVRHLRRQTIADRIELVIAAMERDDFTVDPGACEGLWGTQLVHSGRGSHGEACAAGVRAARAPIVAFAEDHCFPEPGWAEALLDGYTSGEIAAVGPVFRNANPGTLLSWCDFALAYGPWMAPGRGGDHPFLAGHNSSYRREALLGLGSRLDDLLEAETVLYLELRNQGRRLVLQPRARSAHTNFAHRGAWISSQFHGGRVFAAERAKRWGRPRRALYTVASPLIPLVRLVRTLGHLRRAEAPRPSLVRVAPLLTLGLLLDGAGQCLGYLVGSGRSVARLTDFEFGRVKFVAERDRDLWSEPPGHSGAVEDGSADRVSSPASQ